MGLSAEHEQGRFLSVLLADQITVIWNESVFEHQDLQMFLCEIKQIWVISTHLKLWVAVAKVNSTI